MTHTPTNTSLQTAVDDYLAQRRARGYQLKEAERHLYRFLEWLWREGNRSSSFTIQEILAWVHADKGAATEYKALKLGAVRGFSDYCQGIGIDAEVVPKQLALGTGFRRLPHIYTQEEVDALISACPTVFHRHPFVAETMTTLIRLLCATGIRLSEALKIGASDIDTNANALLVKASKNGADHLIPIHPTTTEALVAYANHPERARLDLQVGDLLFISIRNRPHKPVNMQGNYAKLRDACGIPWEGFLPRLHDFRHTFATRQMIRAYTLEGGCPDNTLALLANWLGHTNPAHTYWYTQNIPELLALAVNRRDQKPALGPRK